MTRSHGACIKVFSIFVARNRWVVSMINIQKLAKGLNFGAVDSLEESLLLPSYYYVAHNIHIYVLLWINKHAAGSWLVWASWRPQMTERVDRLQRVNPFYPVNQTPALYAEPILMISIYLRIFVALNLSRIWKDYAVAVEYFARRRLLISIINNLYRFVFSWRIEILILEIDAKYFHFISIYKRENLCREMAMK